MDDLKNYFEIIDNDNGIRKMLLKAFIIPKTEHEKFTKYNGATKKCPKCKRHFPKNTYFFMSGGNNRYDGLHGMCKECEGTSFGWGRNKNYELQKDGLKYCKKCDRILPLNEIFFSKTTGRFNQKTGFMSNCKECNGHQFGIDSINNHREELGIKDGYKICTCCLNELPDSDDYFYKKNNRLNGSTICKYCRSQKNNKQYKRPYLNVSKKYNLNNNEKYCTKCEKIFKTEELNKYNNIYLCDECYKKYNRMKYEKRRSFKNNLPYNLTEEEWENTLKYFNNSCAYCGMSNDDCLKIFNRNLEQDHVIPLSHGGGFTKFNIIPSCRSCNSSKYNKSLDDFFMSSNNFTKLMYDKILQFIEEYKIT